MTSNIKYFDLNIGKILEHWNVEHAVREFIANGLDETLMSKSSKPLEITELGANNWVIKDYGRGIKPEHFVQSEDDEKLLRYDVIGKFGFGLKDAIATLTRNNIIVVVKSKYGTMQVSKKSKFLFDDIVTLHMEITPTTNKDMIGTEIIMSNLTENDINKSKEFFLVYSNLKMVSSTEVGDIYEKTDGMSYIYINGIKVSQEENFMYSYNITAINAKMRKALNRERTNLGRSIYAERIQKILLNSNNDIVKNELKKEIGNIEIGCNCDEINYKNVQLHAIKLLSQNNKKVVFLTKNELSRDFEKIDVMKKQGYDIVVNSNNVQKNLKNIKDDTNTSVITYDKFVNKVNKTRGDYTTMPNNKLKDELTDRQLKVWKYAPKIFSWMDLKYFSPDVHISRDLLDKTGAIGMCRGNEIIIDICNLSDVKKLSGVLL